MVNEKELAKKIHEKFDLVTNIPKWKERIILKPRAVVFEEPKAEIPAPDVKTIMLNTLIDLENELKGLRKRIEAQELVEKIEEDLNRLKYIEEELRTIMSN